MREATFNQALDRARSAPAAVGRVDFLMQRPAEGVHQPVGALYFDVVGGIRGDRWAKTAWLRLPDGRPDPRVQVSLTNTRVIRCFTGSEAASVYRCGDNCYVDFNLTEAALPVRERLQIGEAVLEVSDVENDACGKFATRFGVEAFQCVRRPAPRPLRLRGIFCSIITSGWVRTGDSIKRI